ncbi:MAG: prolyl oligopeptidase family serine peptidase [Actinomycetota bacterium]|nr:prolyl oligopeptidase family serine peptidase [Actinomycetota bacterium]
MDARDMVIDSGGITLRGKVEVPSGDEAWPLAVLCHGIPSGPPVEGDPGYPALAGMLVRRGLAACYFNFRGTGISGGDFSLAGWVTDLEAVLSEAAEARGPFGGCDPGKVALMGFSGGGAVSIVCAARRGGLRGVATLSAPSDLPRLIPREGLGMFISHARRTGIIRDAGFPPSEDDFYREMVEISPIAEVARLYPTPLLLVHGDGDDMVPVGEAKRLYDTAQEPKELYIVNGGGHKLRHNPEAVGKAVSWIADRLRP